MILSMIALCALAPGCAHRRLQINTVKQAQTVVELEYQQILDNLAMFCLNPAALPSLATLKTGATQVGDTGTLGFLGVTGNKGTFGNSPTIAGTRTIVDQWGLSPVTDDTNLLLLSKAFRSALGDQQLLNVDQANNLAHDLSSQIGTTADMSVDRDTLGSIFSQSVLSGALAQVKDPDRARRSPPPGTPEAEALQREQNAELKTLAQRLAMVDEIINREITSTLDEKILVESHEFPNAGPLKVQLFKDANDIPPEGENLVVVAAVGGGLRFRIFDPKGNIIGSDEEKLKRQAQQIEGLRKKLDGLWPPHELTGREMREIAIAVASIVGLTPYLKLRFVPAEEDATGLAKETVYRINDLQKTLDEISSGWLRCGPEKPKGACYVGHACFCGQECYVWVCRDGLAGLSDFTRAALKLGSAFRDVQVVTAPSGIQFAPALTNTLR